MGEPSPLPIVLTRLCLGSDAGLFGSHFSIYLPRYRDGCGPGAAARRRLPPGAARNTCPSVRLRSQSLPGQEGGPSPSPSHRPLRTRRSWDEEEPRGPHVYSETGPPKPHFSARNEIASCWRGGKLAINILVWILCARHHRLWAVSQGEAKQHAVINQQVPVCTALPLSNKDTNVAANKQKAKC